ncbi:MAG: protease complex subunit PrcB family protein [Candidatus Palauibacterales bacterium]|nr:protease complex subunit PrcB family protein [Candidatus Palauibacterales bacterium]
MTTSRMTETASTVALLAGVVLIAGGCGLGSVTGVPADATLVPDDRMELLVDESYSGFDERSRQLIRTSAAWEEAWRQLHEGRSDVPERPAVDFETSMVVLATMGSRRSGGYDIDVESVHRDGESMYVVVTERSPGESCGVTAAITTPATAVRVPRADGEVEFVEKDSVHECS